METQPSQQPRTEIAIDEDLYELVPGFCESRMADVKNIGRMVADKDFTSIAKVSHTIKGIARPYGFPTLETLARTLETAAKAGDEATCASVQAEMDAYMKTYCS